MIIRMATEKDLPRMLEIYRPYVERTTYSFEYTVPTLEEFTRRFQTVTARFPWLVCERDGVLLGYAYGSAAFERAAYGWCAQASAYLRPDAHRQGIGSALYRVLETILKEQGYVNLYAVVTAENEISLAFHRAVGYEDFAVFPRCGYKHGRWVGVVWLQKCLNFTENSPVPPVSVKDIVNINRLFP